MSIPSHSSKFKSFLDLTRAHFIIVWPVIFLSGLFMAFEGYGSFDWRITIKAVLISTLGFEAAFILNDIVDIEYDKRDVDWNITKYWRPFGSRPLASGDIGKGSAQFLFAFLLVLVAGLIYTLPTPNRYYLYAIMAYTFSMEYFYQVKKRTQRLPVAQLLGRTDFMMFAAAGYLCYGRPDTALFLYCLFFYTLAEIHLGINDLSDYNNDIERELKTVTTMYGTKGNLRWIIIFTALHVCLSVPFFVYMGGVSLAGFAFGIVMLSYICQRLRRDTSPDEARRVVPLFHLTLLIYMVSIIIGSALAL
ncbi:MAG: UbiA family prenyltransferase [Candidatus Methanofastidiosa archaeon]|nr:UbiA family prenyltransferase [Candidatus Methanofastidiosa archaeon]